MCRQLKGGGMEIFMELKAIIAIALVVFIIGGLIFLKVRSRKK